MVNAVTSLLSTYLQRAGMLDIAVISVLKNIVMKRKKKGPEEVHNFINKLQF